MNDINEIKRAVQRGAFSHDELSSLISFTRRCFYICPAPYKFVLSEAILQAGKKVGGKVDAEVVSEVDAKVGTKVGATVGDAVVDIVIAAVFTEIGT